jgi:hypothetical protein
MTDYFAIAKDITRFHWPTLAEANWQDGYKPRCRWCFVPCHPRDYGYRSCQLCEYCYDEQPPVQTQPKALLPINKEQP